MRKKQRLVAVEVTTAPAPSGAPAIRPVGGESLEEILDAWRIVQIQPLGPDPGGAAETYAALLLLEEAPPEGGLGRLGFGQ